MFSILLYPPNRTHSPVRKAAQVPGEACWCHRRPYLRTFSGLEGPPSQHVAKVFKGRYISPDHLGAKNELGKAAYTMKSLGRKRLGKEIYGDEDFGTLTYIVGNTEGEMYV